MEAREARGPAWSTTRKSKQLDKLTTAITKRKWKQWEWAFQMTRILQVLPGVVVEPHVVVAPIVLELLPVFAVFACCQQDDVLPVVKVVQRVAEGE